jgi:hypothetical protein
MAPIGVLELFFFLLLLPLSFAGVAVDVAVGDEVGGAVLEEAGPVRDEEADAAFAGSATLKPRLGDTTKAAPALM